MKISKITAVKNADNLVIVTDSFENHTAYGLHADDVKYIQEQIKKDKKSITINKHGRIISVQIPDAKKESYLQIDALRKAGSSIADTMNANKNERLVVTGSHKNQILAVAEGAALANYQFIKYRKEKVKEANSLKEIALHGDVNATDVSQLEITIDATYQARNLVNEPVNYLNATGLANAFKDLGKKGGFKVEVLNKAKIKQQKMGGLLSVNLGSVDEPTFTIMEYKPAKAKNKKPYVLVGKGVVYDTGGLSIKPTAGMDTMKCDMAGAAAVGAAIYAIAKAKLPVHVIALVPATDNRPGFNAFAPGDIITTMEGLTVEMLNSDAEGRMILCDALTYAKKYKPELVFDFATLTGAAVAAIGTSATVVMGTASEEIKQKVKTAGYNVYERLAEFPFWDDYADMLKSDIADMKNIGGPQAGSITAGKFLQKFTDYPWLHFDIAGPAFLGGRDGYRIKGGTGVGVRLLFEFFKNV